MKLFEFKQAISSYRKTNIPLDKSLIDRKITLKVKYSTRSTGGAPVEEKFIDFIFIDQVKNRIFFVGKSDDLKIGFFSRKKPLEIKVEKFLNWTQKRGEYDNYEVYFAWQYDFKDEEVFDYIPLMDKISYEPELDARNLKTMVFYTVENAALFKVKVKNLNEKLMEAMKKCQE